jgi:hypothetical protein
MVTLVNRDLGPDSAASRGLGVDHGPVMAISGEDFMGISYYGYPARKELAPFLDGVVIASGGAPPMVPDTAGFLADLKKDVHIRVFVTPD